MHSLLHSEPLAEVKLTADWIVDEEIFCPFALNAPFENQVGAIDDGKRFAHVMIGDHDGETRFAQIYNDLLHIVDRDRINAAKRFVEHEQLRLASRASAQ